MKFSRQEYWSGLPCPTPGELPDPGIEPFSVSVSYSKNPPGRWILYHWRHLGRPKQVKDLTVSPKTTTTTTKNTPRREHKTCFDLNQSNICLDLSPKAKETKQK